MKNNNDILGDIPLSIFLQEYWQQKPLLIRSAFPNYSSPIEANEMAGLACESEVESRIILERDGEYPWQCLHGPIDEAMFSKLPETHWTLLLQSCNLHVPALAQLLEEFRFIPNWRVDDVMVSYAAPGGSVGAHTDNYDVFLLQAQGTRHWQISTKTVDENDFIPDLDMKILKSFTAEQSWSLNAGDMLYLPPGVAHHGIADDDMDGDDCITISIGFRAPNMNELSIALLDEILSQQSSDNVSESNIIFYQDPNLTQQENSGEISTKAVNDINTMLQQELNNKMQDSDWFGKYITSTNENEIVSDLGHTVEQCLHELDNGSPLIRNEFSKLAFIIDRENSEQQQIHFFCNGQVSYHSMALYDIIRIVCNERFPSSRTLLQVLTKNEQARSFLADLINQGHFYYEQDADDEY